MNRKRIHVISLLVIIFTLLITTSGCVSKQANETSLTSENFFLEEKSATEYYCEIYSNDEKLILSETFSSSPVFKQLEASLYELKGQKNSHKITYYINTETGYLSEAIDGEGFYLKDNTIAFVYRIPTFTDDGQTKTGYLTYISVFDLSENRGISSISADFLSKSISSYSIDYIDDTHIQVTYCTEDGETENKKLLEIPSISGES